MNTGQNLRLPGCPSMKQKREKKTNKTSSSARGPGVPPHNGVRVVRFSKLFIVESFLIKICFS